MRKHREILRQVWELGRKYREVQAQLGVGLSTVNRAVTRAQAAGLDWTQVQALSEEDLERRLHGAPEHAGERGRPLPDGAWIHTERRRPGVTLELLHLEYLAAQPEGYRYTQFCEYYRRWVKKRRLSMHQVHVAGEKIFVDYSGKRPHIIDPKTGAQVPVELFVAVLGASNYTYVEASLTQQSHDWIASHIGALEYFGGASTVLVSDNLKSGVTKPCRYEPGANRGYNDMAEHYGMVVIPARPRKPKDKAKVEVAVQVAQRWILARLRNERHFSLESLNERIAELLEDLNTRVMRKYGQSRRQLFERLDQPALRPLPAQRYVYTDWKKARVNIDYHVELEKHYYSVPHALRGELVEIRYTASTVEVLARGQRVASHLRSHKEHTYTTVAEHMPKSHRAHMEWTPSRLIHWASSIGPHTRDLVRFILETRKHPEQGYRSCLGILRLSRQYDSTRLEAACMRGLAARARSYGHIKSILEKGLDRAPLPLPPAEEQPTLPLFHQNVRGGQYYQ